MLTTIGLFVLGLVLLVAGGELLVRGASRAAGLLGVSRLVIGLTVVAAGTSAPEAVVSVLAAVRGTGDIALGNVVGSNIFNVLVILGLSALVAPLVVSRQLVRLDVPLLIVVSGLAVAAARDGRLGRIDGAIAFAGLIGYMALSVVVSRRDRALTAQAGVGGETPFAAGGGEAGAAKEAGPPPRRAAALAANAALVVAGLALLILGSRWLVDSAVVVARLLGLSELVIGLTIVAAGTSLPEAATSVLAAVRGERDIAVGNVVGSNLFNLLGVLGLSAMVAPGGLAVPPAALSFDLPVMLAVAVVCLPIFFNGLAISRWEGALLFGYYGVYTAYLILRAGEHDALAGFSWVVGAFVLPLTGITLLVVTVGNLWKLRRRRVTPDA